MTKVLTWTFAFVFGSLGGWALSRLGFMASFLGGVVGTALGIYFGRKLARHYGG